ncbi:hypothetical protein SAMN05216476_2157 [Pseudomonas mediterranea]|uniref:Uncharacterized protein n=1 Tax=Pseudomonas mediterranea TaxID=183795 RepID=A0AAX2DAD1_9PSED|nr:hypothetical protein SAMN05216476_2157 [Pseudomonas mediterranea]
MEGAGQASVSPGRHTEAAESQPTTLQVSEITQQASPHGDGAPVSLDDYHLSAELIPLLSAPDATSGIRTFRTRTYVELEDGATVLLGRDAEQNYRARSSTELIASGPRLEQVEGSLLWRRVPQPVEPGSSDSPQTITPYSLDEPSEASAPKRQRTMSPAQSEAAVQGPAVFRRDWAFQPTLTLPHFITVNDVHYKVMNRMEARDFPMLYIQPPSHPAYDFDVLEAILRHTPDEQPRAVIRVPPDNHWEIDARLPFEKPLTAYVRDAFPEVTTVTLENIARKQFELANSSTYADAAGLTALRQIFHSWRQATPSPHPQWSDPLLMLSILPTSSGVTSTSRAIELPFPSTTGTLDRMDFDPMRFRRQWDFFLSTYSTVDFKRFMAGLLSRNGYTVMEPNNFNSFPALVFRRTGHDYLFFMSLHRTRIPKLSLPTHTNPNTTGMNLETQVGDAAAQAVKDAHAANKIIWLKGGSQILPGHADTVFIIRDDNARL